MRSMVEGYLPWSLTVLARTSEGRASYPSTTFGGPPPPELPLAGRH
jgi:hypothetical protein